MDKKKCSACGCVYGSATHKKNAARCSQIKWQRLQAYKQTQAYQNEQAALKESKEREEKLKQVPFAPVFDRRGKPFKTQFS
jgi:transposase